MAPGGRVGDQHRFGPARSQEYVALSVAGKIGYDATGVSLGFDSAEKIARIDFRGVEESLAGPVIDQQHRSAPALGSAGVGDNYVQIAVIVHVGELPARPAELSVLVGETLVGRKGETARIGVQFNSFVAEDQNVPVAVLVRIAGSGADGVGCRQAGVGRIEHAELTDPVVDPR